MKKLFLFCLAVISCCGCLPTEQNIKSTEWVDTNVGYFKYVEYDGHEYLVFSNGGHGAGICHSPKCPCQNKK